MKTTIDKPPKTQEEEICLIFFIELVHKLTSCISVGTDFLTEHDLFLYRGQTGNLVIEL